MNATVSHEMRNPLNSFINQTMVIKEVLLKLFNFITILSDLQSANPQTHLENMLKSIWEGL
jgi:signal transduction histidine kinase